jgi:hypothetical protein
MSSLHKHTYEQAKQFFQREKYEEALALLEKMESVLIEDAKKTMLARAKCLARLGRFEEALKICETVSMQFGDERGKSLADSIVPLAAHPEAALAPVPLQSTAPLLAPLPKRPRCVWKWAIRSAAAIVILGVATGLAGYVFLGQDDSSPLVGDVKEPAVSDSNVAHAQAQPPAGAASDTPAGPQLQLRGVALEEILKDEPAHPAHAPSTDIVDPVQSRQQLKVPEPPAAPTAPAPSTPVARVAAPVVAQQQGINVLDIQPYLAKQTLTNQRGDEISLSNVNPNVGAWYVLDVNIQGQRVTLHLDVPAINGDVTLRPLLSLYRDGLMLSMPGQPPKLFPLWPNEGADVVLAADVAGAKPELPPTPALADLLRPDYKWKSPYTAICEGSLLVRTQKGGSSTKMEMATDMLRTTRVGDWFVAQAKPYLIQEPEVAEDMQGTDTSGHPAGAMAPKDALIDPSQVNHYSPSANMGFPADVPQNRYYFGKWYKAVDRSGVFVSLMKAGVIDKKILDTYKNRVGSIGIHDRKKREAEALVYLVALDLDEFRFGFTMGADHPKVEWSDRVPKNPKLKGPDGFDTKKPLATIGAIPPYLMPYIEGTFTGGFKRKHGAFVSGPFSKAKNNSHFGFMEEGAIFSTLQPGLATAVIRRDGSLDLLAWPQDSRELLPQVAHARQNCVPIIEGVDANGSIPGALVNQGGPGAWSGDQHGDFLSLRAGLATQESNGHRFLIFAYFTGATPNAMARVFQAYQCRFAMLLDMNTTNYCYCALYTHGAGAITGAEYLHKDMAAGNGPDGSLKFLEKNDTRDSFYILRKVSK